MSKELKLYHIYVDDDCHRYLIPKDDYRSFEKALERVDDSFDEHGDEDIYYEELEDILDHFSKGRLEGEEYFVVLAEDLMDE